MKPDFDLRGKDWLTEVEAAHYCCVSLTQFKGKASSFNARRFMGKKVYSRAELFDAISAAPPWYAPTKSKAVCRGGLDEANPKTRNLRAVPLRSYKPRRWARRK
jgi:hypothetical protein